MNVRDVVRLSSSWDDEQQDMGELNKLLVPVLIKALDYDIQDAASNTISAVQSGVGVLYEKKKGQLSNRRTNKYQNVHTQDESNEITPKPKQPLTNEEVQEGPEDMEKSRVLTLNFVMRIIDLCSGCRG